MKRILILMVTIAFLAMIAIGQNSKTSTAKETTPELHKVPAPQISAASGEANYKAYCAACHGTSGKGDGPAAPALKLPPTDLTRLAANTGGKYPAIHVQASIRNAESAAHGSKDMPVWGPVFRSISNGDQGDVELRVSNLTKYIETLQTK